MALATTTTRTKADPRQRGIVLQTVEQTTSVSAKALQAKMQADKEQSGRIKNMAEQLQDAIKNRDIDQVKILSADFETASKNAAANSRDLAEVMIALESTLKDVGISLEEVQKSTPEEQKLVTDATEYRDRLKATLTVRETEVIKAEGSWVMRGTRVAGAELARDRAKADLQAAEAGITTATQVAEKMKRDRLQSASLEASMQSIQAVTQQVASIAQDRITEIEADIEAIQAGREATVEDQQRLALQVQDGDHKMAEVNSQLANMRDELKEIVDQNSPEWVALNGRIKATENELAEVERERNKAFSLSQGAQRFLEMFSRQEAAQRGLRQFQEIWIANLEEGVKQRNILYDSHLGVLKAAGDQKAMATTESVAMELDERITQSAVEHHAAVMTNMGQYLESMPEYIRRMRKFGEIQAQAKSDHERRMQTLLEEFRKNWGTPQGYDDSAAYAEQRSA